MPPKKTAKAAPAPRSAPATTDYEKLGVFYLGRPYDVAAKSAEPGVLLEGKIAALVGPVSPSR